MPLGVGLGVVGVEGLPVRTALGSSPGLRWLLKRNFVEHLCRCFHVMLPRQAQQRGTLPSQSTLKRQRFLLDLAFVRARQLHMQVLPPAEAHHVRFMLADSSPQVGRNWLWIDETRVMRAHLIRVCQSHTALCLQARIVALRWQRQEEALWRSEALLESLTSPELMQHAKELERCIVEHTYTPVSLGKWQSDVIGKGMALCHAMGLENPSQERLQHSLAEVRALCTDMGAEMNLTEIAIPLYPTWVAETSQSIGTGVLDVAADPDTPIEEGTLDMEQCAEDRNCTHLRELPDHCGLGGETKCGIGWLGQFEGGSNQSIKSQLDQLSSKKKLAFLPASVSCVVLRLQAWPDSVESVHGLSWCEKRTCPPPHFLT